MGFTSRVLRVDPSERRTTALVASLMFMSLAGAAIGESGINALFFDRIGTEALPLMYLAQAGSTLVAMFALTATLERVQPSIGLRLVTGPPRRRGARRTRCRADRCTLDLPRDVGHRGVRHARAGDRPVGDRGRGGGRPPSQAPVPDLRRGRHPRVGRGRVSSRVPSPPPSARRTCCSSGPAACSSPRPCAGSRSAGKGRLIRRGRDGTAPSSTTSGAASRTSSAAGC